MGIPNILNTGRSGMVAAKASIATTGHNIANANSEGYSRQRVHQESELPKNFIGHSPIGDGVKVSRVDRVNDEYVEKQIRNAGKDLAHMEEKDLVLRQTEDIFNEMNGDGLNRIMSKFFNEFRKLANEPDNDAVRQSVRESSIAMVNDFKRIRRELMDVSQHIDARIEGYSREANGLADQIKDLNFQIHRLSLAGGSPNDLLDKRDLALKQLGTLLDVSMHTDKDGNYDVDIRGVGPLVTGNQAEKLSTARTPADDQGKPENGVDIKTTASANGTITHMIKGGKLGALLEVRDHTLSSIFERMDDMAHEVTEAVNAVHRQGFTRDGVTGVNFFKPLEGSERAAEFIDLSDEVKSSPNFIATAAAPDAPGDNRIALALASLQERGLMNDGRTTADEYYNSIISDVGVVAAKNRSSLNQQRDILTQLDKIREQTSGVSIDEETANLMQFQHAFGASAKVIQVADEMLKTVMDIKR